MEQARDARGRSFEWFDVLRHRTTLSADLELRTGGRIGVGRDHDALTTDLPVMRDRDRDGPPLIPGSSLKGVVRSAAERLLRGLAVSLDAAACQPQVLRRIACDPLSSDKVAGCCLERQEDGESDEETRSSRERVAERQRELEQGVCLACATFGGPGLASHFRFQDAVAAPGHAVRQRDGVAIDRDLGRVAGSRKYDFEVIEAGARFPFVVVMENPRDWQIGLLLSALDLLDDGLIRVGGFGSRGLGLVRLAGEPRLVRRSLEDILDGREGTLLDEDRRQACRKALLAEVRHALRGKEGC